MRVMRFFVESYGCTMNYGEGDLLGERMEEMGHIRVQSADEADIIILNTCTVVDTTEKNMLRRMMELRNSGKEVIVTGCLAAVGMSRAAIRLPGSLIIPPCEYVTFTNSVIGRYGTAGGPIPSRIGTTIILPIAQGCLGGCTYCITRLARGKLVSYPEKEILDRFERAVKNGAKEILIAAQDTACYGKDCNTDLPTLLRKMLKVPGEYRMRIGMMTPNHLDRILDDMLDVMGDERIYRFLHIPIQSGSDAVLERMNRQYTVEEFMDLVKRARARYPDISIATDMISGFPGETDEDHESSLRLMSQLRMDTANITRFSPRPGTPAADMKQVHGRIAKVRSAELTDMKNRTELDVNSGLIGKTVNILITEKGKDGTSISRTDNYRPVVIDSDKPVGTFTKARIEGCKPTYLIGNEL